MEQAGRDAASDLIKRIADPVLELLLSGYDPSAEDTKARAAAACDDDKWERMVEFTERGLEIRQVSLDQSTLVALAGGQLAFGNVRLGRCLVAVPSIQSLLSSTLLGSVSEPVRVTVESVDIDQLPFPDVALPSEVEKILAKFQALGKQAQNQADAASAGDTPLAAASKHAKKSRKSSFTEQSVVSVQEQQEAVKSEHMRVASEYGPISRLIDGVEIEVRARARARVPRARFLLTAVFPRARADRRAALAHDRSDASKRGGDGDEATRAATRGGRRACAAPTQREHGRQQRGRAEVVRESDSVQQLIRPRGCRE